MAVHISKEPLRAEYVGRSLYQIATPSAVLDLAKVEANCNLMLEAAQRMNISWRAHIKTHKTIELTRLQVGSQTSSPANIIVSTVAEAENIVPLLKEYQESSRHVNVLFAFPIYASCVARLAQVSAQLGPGGLSIMVDHPDQLKHLTSLASKSGNPPLIFLKVNVGTDRAGIIADTPECLRMINQLLVAEAVGSCVFLGVYAHCGHSYYSRSEWGSLEFLGDEFAALHKVAKAIRKDRPDHPLVLSVGATPTATALQHPDFGELDEPMDDGDDNSSDKKDPRLESSGPNPAKLTELLQTLKRDNLKLEVHAGVYPVLDIQQLASHARDAKFLNPVAIALSVLVEVVSLYPGRGRGDTTEALVNCGTLALGREPCRDMGAPSGTHYAGWGILSPWNLERQPVPGPAFPGEHGGWQVGRISQEHGILEWVGRKEDEVELYVGQRLRVWPNHACIAGACHGWYLVVDSRNRGREDEIVDVWPRGRGW